MNFRICFTYLSHFSELLPGDLERSAIFLQDLIGQALNSFPLSTTVTAVELDFCILKSSYFVQIYIRCDVHLAIPNELDALRLEIERIVSQMMLRCFWEIHYSECKGCL
jgi:hypothetical protein